MPRLWKALSLALAVVALGFFAASCSSGGSSYRIINAIANYNYAATGGFDITLNGATVFTGVQFTNVEPPGKHSYQSLSAGGDTLDIFAHGDTTGTAIISSSLSVSGRTQYSVLLMGNNTTNPYVAQPFTDNNAVPASGDFAFRVIDAANNMPASVDIYIVGNPSVVTGPNPPPPNASITYGAASTYQPNPAGTWWLVVTNHGSHTPLISPTSYAPAALQIETIVLVDGPNGFGVGTPLIFDDLGG